MDKDYFVQNFKINLDSLIIKYNKMKAFHDFIVDLRYSDINPFTEELGEMYEQIETYKNVKVVINFEVSDLEEEDKKIFYNLVNNSFKNMSKICRKY